MSADSPPPSDGAETYFDRAGAALTTLASRPLVLAAVALALNAVLVPYLGVIHDARLYALQTKNRLHDGAFGHDLFLRYGSQDQFSAFSAVAAPLAGAVGVPSAFFLIYLAARVVFCYGLARFLLGLFGPTPVAALAVLVLAVDPVAFGGMHIFTVNEPFTTPRLPACGLVLLGLSFLIARRWAPAAGCFVGALLLHPLMGLVGAAMFAAWAVYSLWPARGLVILTGCAVAGSVGLLAYPPLSYRLFGTMDAAWIEQVRIVSSFNFPTDWRETDWRRLVVCVAVVLVAAGLWARAERGRADFLRVAVLVGVTGLVATTVAGLLGYKLLLQGQPYRMVWLLHLLAVPCAVQLVAWAWAAGNERHRVAALVAAGALLCSSGLWVEWGLPLLVLPVAVGATRGLLAEPRLADWPSRSVAWALALGLVAWSAYRTGVVLSMGGLLATRFDGNEFLYILLVPLGPILAVLGSASAAVLLAPALRRDPGRVAACAVVVALGVQSATFALSASGWYERDLTTLGGRVPFVRAILAERRAETDRPPTIYWTSARADTIWLRLDGCSYFGFIQLAGLLFNRDTAEEAFRRARLVGAFEVAYYRRFRDTYPPDWDDWLQDLYGVRYDDANPTGEDLFRLATDPALDYVVTDRDLGCPFLASDGTVYVYDCARLRALASGR